MAFSKLCEWVEPKLSLSLIAQNYKTKLLECASLVHSNVRTHCFGFECNLKGPEYWGDLLFYILSSDLHTFHKASTYGEMIAGNNNHTLVAFLENWTKQDFFNKKKVTGIWIELDVGSSMSWPPQPNLFLQIDGSQEQYPEAIDEAFHQLKKIRLSKERRSLLVSCSTNDIKVYSVGFMLARSTNAMRICTKSKDLLLSDDYTFYLKILGLGWAEKAFCSLLEKIRPFLSRITFDLDLNDHFLPKFGVSCYIEETSDPSIRRERWDSFLKVLVSLNLVDEGRYSGLISWIGNQLENQVPSSISDFINLKEHILRRSISHIKVVFDPNCSLQAKAYLQVDNIIMPFE